MKSALLVRQPLVKIVKEKTNAKIYELLEKMYILHGDWFIMFNILYASGTISALLSISVILGNNKIDNLNSMFSEYKIACTKLISCTCMF